MTATAIKAVVPGPGLVDALIAARKEFGPLVKNKENPHFRSRFASLDAVNDVADDVLANHGLAVVQTTDPDASGMLWLVTELCHAPTGEVKTSRWPLVPAKDRDPQALGACLTYGLRYQKMAVLGLASEDDDGNAASERDPKAPAKAPPKVTPKPSGPVMITPNETIALQIALKEADLNSRDACLQFCTAICKRPVASSKDLTQAEFHACLDAARESRK